MGQRHVGGLVIERIGDCLALAVAGLGVRISGNNRPDGKQTGRAGEAGSPETDRTETRLEPGL